MRIILIPIAVAILSVIIYSCQNNSGSDITAVAEPQTDSVAPVQEEEIYFRDTLPPHLKYDIDSVLFFNRINTYVGDSFVEEDYIKYKSYDFLLRKGEPYDSTSRGVIYWKENDSIIEIRKSFNPNIGLLLEMGTFRRIRIRRTFYI